MKIHTYNISVTDDNQGEILHITGIQPQKQFIWTSVDSEVSEPQTLWETWGNVKLGHMHRFVYYWSNVLICHWSLPSCIETMTSSLGGNHQIPRRPNCWHRQWQTRRVNPRTSSYTYENITPLPAPYPNHNLYPLTIKPEQHSEVVRSS